MDGLWLRAVSGGVGSASLAVVDAAGRPLDDLA
jgi:hypothetical protein